MKILHVAPSFYPAIKWGGPVFSTKAICDGVAKLPNKQISVLTTDAAGPSASEKIDQASQMLYEDEGYSVTYTRRIAGHSISPGLLLKLPQAIKQADIVHLTGTYNFPTLFTLLFAKFKKTPVVWSPRGALQATAKWANAPRVRIKHLFEKVAQWVRPQDTVLLVTSPQEGEDSVSRLKDISVHVLPNSVEIPSPNKVYKDQGTDRSISLVFLSRLHPKKGVELLLNAMRDLPAEFTLEIYGDGDPDYILTLKEAAVDLDDRVTFNGIVSGDAKVTAYQNADIFVLPSHSENFGIVVAEALAAGTPVVTTTNTPWHDIEKNKCGRCVDLDKEELSEVIRDLAQKDLVAMGQAGRAWMQHSFANEALSEELAKLYATLT